MLLKQTVATEKAMLFREWGSNQPPTGQQTINEWRRKLSKLNQVSEVSADELLCEIFIRVIEDARRKK